MKDRPRLRPLEAFPFEHEGKKLVALRDPMGLVPGIALIGPELFLVASHFDGARSFEEVREALKAGYGLAIDDPTLQEVVDSLDEKLFLDNERFHRAMRELHTQFVAATTRPAFHAGSVYPAERDEAAKHIDEMLAPSRSKGDTGSPAKPPRQLPTAILSPHIDYARGAATYAKTWGPLRDASAPPLFVVLATSHAPMHSLLGLTKKDYETPFGVATTDRDFVAALTARLPEPAHRDEFCHRGEHAAELQIHILRHLFPQAKFAPILCGDFGRHAGEKSSPGGNAIVEQTVEALRSTLRERPGAILVLGVDLAHVGPRFGFPEILDASYLAQVEAEDRLSLDRAAACDAEGFYRAVIDGGDPRKVCGLSPVYLGLRCLENRKGKLLDYRQCTSEDQSVTIAGMIWD